MSRSADGRPRRPIFRDGDVLTRELFGAEADYHAGSRQRHLDGAHPQRARTGLELVLDGEDLLLLAGEATDDRGRLFQVPQALRVPLASLAADLGETGWLELCLAGHPGAHGADGRLTLTWRPLDADGQPVGRPPDVPLVLGRLQRDGDGHWRQPAPGAPLVAPGGGARLELDRTGLTLRDGHGDPALRLGPATSRSLRPLRCEQLDLAGPLDLAPAEPTEGPDQPPTWRLALGDGTPASPSRLEVHVGGTLQLAVDGDGVHPRRVDRSRATPWTPAP